MNENYTHPELPKDQEKNIIKGMYLLQENGSGKKRVQLMGSGSILREVIAAGELLAVDFDIQSDIWSCPSFNQLKRDVLLKTGHPAKNIQDKDARTRRFLCHRV